MSSLLGAMFPLFLLLCVCNSVTHAFNLTDLRRSSTGTNKRMVASTLDETEWMVQLWKPLGWESIMNVNTQLSLNESLGCDMQWVAQNTRATLFTLLCQNITDRTDSEQISMINENTAQSLDISSDSVKIIVERNKPVKTSIDVSEEVNITTVQMNAPWHLDRIDQPSLPLDGKFHFPTYPGDGSGVNVFVIDTGVLTTHEEFEGRATFMLNSAGDGINSDCNGHGTHVSGLAVGKTFGVAKGSNLYAYKALDCNGDGTTFTITTAAMAITDHQTATNNAKPGVINLSLNGGTSDSFDTTISDLVTTYGFGVCVAAGNSYGDSSCNYSPSRVSTVLTCCATTSVDTVATFSNLGTCTNLCGPGQSVLSAWNTCNNCTKVLSGTSMTTPQCSGGVALCAQKRIQQKTVSSNPGQQAMNDFMAATVTVAGIGYPFMQTVTAEYLAPGDTQGPDEYYYPPPPLTSSSASSLSPTGLLSSPSPSPSPPPSPSTPSKAPSPTKSSVPSPTKSSPPSSTTTTPSQKPPSHPVDDEGDDSNPPPSPTPTTGNGEKDGNTLLVTAYFALLLLWFL